MDHRIHFWRLVDPELIGAPFIDGVHNHWLCLVAVLIAVLAAGVLLPVTNRYRVAHPRHRKLWLWGGGLAMGTGIWAMHFTAMLAYQLPLPVNYDAVITVVSILPAVLASAVSIVSYRSAQQNHFSLQCSAIAMAVGIGAMHYLGMEAVNVPAHMYYSPGLFVLSIFAAYVLALLGLYIHALTNRASGLDSRIGLVAGSVVLGIAVSGMHFTAMKATYFVANDQQVSSQLVIAPYGLVALIIFIAIFLIGSMLASVSFDRRFYQVRSSLKESEMRFSQLAENTQMAIFTFDKERVIYANPALCAMLDYSLQKINRLTLKELFGEAFEHLANDMLTPPLLFDRAFHEEFKIETPSGDTKWIYISVSLTQFNDGHLGIASGFDISDQKQAEYSLRELAYHDQLTMLANRTMFIDRLDHHLKLLARNENDIDSCVMLVDLDGFKRVNDSHGHHVGDELLCTVANCLKNVCRDSDTVARLGGDEFVLLFENLGASTDWSSVADKIMQALAQPQCVTEKALEIGASIGVLPLRDTHYSNADDVLRDVDIAMYRAKHYKEPCWVMFDSGLDAAARRARTLQGELKQAIHNGDLQLYYQGIVNVENKKVVGFEALSRWQRSNGEWVSPGEFIPLAERSGLITDISIWALRTATAQLLTWLDNNNEEIYISINAAAECFDDERFMEELQQVRQRLTSCTGLIKLELTESMLMKNADTMLARLETLTEMGFRLMLDDFGTGYSSLSSLAKLPIATVKIDQSFVADLGGNTQAASIVKTIISLANQLNMRVISEGVETEAQMEALKLLGCNLMQGYYFAKPVPAALAEEFLRESRNGGPFHLPKHSSNTTHLLR